MRRFQSRKADRPLRYGRPPAVGGRRPCGKIRHRCRLDAEGQIKQLLDAAALRPDHATLNAYFCGRCDAWHVGHDRERAHALAARDDLTAATPDPDGRVVAAVAQLPPGWSLTIRTCQHVGWVELVDPAGARFRFGRAVGALVALDEPVDQALSFAARHGHGPLGS